MGLKGRLTRSPAVDAIMPDSVHLSAGEWQMQGQWYRSFSVIAYPREVQPGWFEPLLRFPRPLAITLYSGPVPYEAQLGSMRRSLLWSLGSEESSRSSGRLADPLQHTAIEDAQRIRQGIARGETRLIETHLTLTLWGNSRQELEESSNLLVSMASGMLLVVRVLRYQQDLGLRRMLPVFGSPPHPRDMDTEAWATLFPYASQELIHPQGQVWGTNAKSRSLVIVDRFQLPSPHSVTVAWSGAGKSFSAKLEILRSRYRGLPVKVLDPEGEYRVLEKAGAHVWAIGDPVNPAFPWDPFVIYAGDSAEDVERQTDFLVRFLQRLDPSVDQMAPAAERALWRILKERPQTAARDQPYVFRHERNVLCDGTVLLKVLGEINPMVAERVESLIHRWRVLAPERKGISAEFEVFDLSRLTQRMKAAAYLALTEHIARTVTQVHRQLVVFDEAWQLLIDEKTAEYLEALYRRARKWGTALSIITQDIGDFTRSQAAQVCLRNSPIVLLLRQHAESLTEIAQLMRLEQGEIDLLTLAQRGQGLLIVGDDHVPLNVVAAPHELHLISHSE